MFLNEPSLPLRDGENATIGGFEPKQLKNENGLTFNIPSSEIVETSAIGLGPIPPNNNWCNFGTGNSFGLKCCIFFFSCVISNSDLAEG